MAEARYYPYFDYLRAAAALGVFAAHADPYHLLPSNFGNACVQLFFALSGFLIGGILLKSRPKDMPRFYFNRAARIWIPYAIAILLLAAVTALKQGLADPKFREFFFYMWTFVYNWFGPPQLAEFRNRMPLDGTANHFWSVCVEEQFYLVAPFLLLFFNRIVLLAGLTAATLLSPEYFASISLGVVLAMLGPNGCFIAASAAVGAVAAILGSYTAAAPCLSVAVVGAIAIKGPQTTLGRIAGGASYPFYLNHWIGLFAYKVAMNVGLPILFAWPFGLLTASGLSIAHYFAIDRVIAARRDDWFSVRRGILLCALGFALAIAGFAGAALYGAAIR